MTKPAKTCKYYSIKQLSVILICNSLIGVYTPNIIKLYQEGQVNFSISTLQKKSLIALPTTSKNCQRKATKLQNLRDWLSNYWILDKDVACKHQSQLWGFLQKTQTLSAWEIFICGEQIGFFREGFTRLVS